MSLLKVRTVYGDTLRVSREQYDAGRVQLSIYTATGRKLADYYAQMNWWGKSTTLHRENIAEVL